MGQVTEMNLNAETETTSDLVSNTTYKVSLPDPILAGLKMNIQLGSSRLDAFSVEVVVDEIRQIATFRDGEAMVPFKFNHSGTIEITIDTHHQQFEVRPIPLWLSVVPPLIAIFLALLFREVISSLFIGIFSGSLIIATYSSGWFYGVFNAFKSVIDVYILEALYDKGHLSVIVFSMLIGGMVAVISKNGGTQGVVDFLTRFARSARSCQLVTWLLGCLIFFDDYANTLIVGNTMRPVTDRFRVSREKLSYLVDSTAAPVAAIAFVTTWIGAELGYISNGIAEIPAIRDHQGPYAIFMNSLQFSFYPVFTLLFIFMLVWKRKDFGPMWHAEKRARQTGLLTRELEKIQDEIIDEDELDELQPKDGVQAKMINAIFPVACVVLGTIGALLYTGWDSAVWSDPGLGLLRRLSKTIGNSDSYTALLWSSLSGVTVAVLLSVSQRILSLSEAIEACLIGFKTMLTAVSILILAWSLALVTEHLHTADFLTGLLSGNLAPGLIPVVTFVLAAFVAFSTGSSWGTMAILYPLMLPAAWTLSQTAGLEFDVSMSIFYNTVSCVLAGSVLGDHCSPISDTTILSSLASSCHHIDHVRTQLPYALTVGAVALCLGTLPAGFGVPTWILFPMGILVLFLLVHFFGREVGESDHLGAG